MAKVKKLGFATNFDWSDSGRCGGTGCWPSDFVHWIHWNDFSAAFALLCGPSDFVQHYFGGCRNGRCEKAGPNRHQTDCDFPGDHDFGGHSGACDRAGH